MYLFQRIPRLFSAQTVVQYLSVLTVYAMSRVKGKRLTGVVPRMRVHLSFATIKKITFATDVAIAARYRLIPNYFVNLLRWNCLNNWNFFIYIIIISLLWLILWELPIFPRIIHDI